MSLYMSGFILHHFHVVFIEAESLSQTYSSQIWLVSIASWLQPCHLPLLRLELQAGCHAHLAFTWVLGTCCIVFLLVSKHFSFSPPGGATGDFGVQGAFLNFIYVCGCRWSGLVTSTHLLSLLVCSESKNS